MEEKTIVVTVREMDALVEDRDGCRFEARTLAADLHEMAKQNVDLTGRLKDWTEKAQQFEDDALEATVERDEMRDERDELRTEVDELRTALQFETEQHTTRIADLENQLAAARQQRDTLTTTRPGLS